MMTSIVRQQSLTYLLSDLNTEDLVLQECKLTDISMDSRRVVPGCLFVALAKNSEDREKHLHQALGKGAFAVLYDAKDQLTVSERASLDEQAVSAYPIKNLSQQVSAIAAKFYDYPSQQMTVIAVTGTNGKTSVSQFIAQALDGVDKSCGIIGTLGAGRLSDLELTGMTTPDPITLQRLLADFKLLGCQYVVMEASSHALEQGRLACVDIDIAVLTNLTRDHLDYHQTMAAYAQAKQTLFEFDSLNAVVLNREDAFGQRLITQLADHNKVISYATRTAADVMANNIDCHLDGIRFDAKIDECSLSVSVPVLGRFNVDNLLATIATLHSLDLSVDEIAKAMTHCQSVNGRMQPYGESSQPRVVIDYAHTPDALKQALLTLREHLNAGGQLWCVFGCGGDRDKGKRSLMGEIAENLADIVVLTDDNPRTENNVAIVSDILAGCAQPEKIHIEHDRKQAIVYAVSHANNTDIILIAGKGHEAYQEIDNVKYPFSDAHVVGEYLATGKHNISNMAGGF